MVKRFRAKAMEMLPHWEGAVWFDFQNSGFFILFDRV
jgi:hypothetical protein